MAADKKPSKAAVAKAAKAAYRAKQNTFSHAPVPAPTQYLDKPEATPTEQQQVRAASTRRRSWRGSEEGRTRSTGFDGQGVVGFLGQAHPALAYEHTLQRGAGGLSMGGSTHEAVQQALRGRSPSLERLEAHKQAVLGPRVPDINAPHHVPDTVVPQRRWEDLHPHEQARTLAVAAQHGVTMGSAKRDYAAQLDQSWQRAARAGAPDPYSARFYSGPSEPHDIIDQSAAANAQHPAAKAAAPGMRVSMRDVQAITNSITSPRNKFSIKKQGTEQTLFPNDEHANTAVQHVLDHPEMSAQQVHDTVPNNSGPSGGGIHGNIRRAAYAAHQLIRGGATPRTLINPSGAPTFGTPSTQKTTAYASAWMQPDSPDAFLTTDVHTGHGFAAHLGTAKKKTATGELGASEVEDYISRTPNVHALHDYLARQVHAERGLSPSTSNARYLHRGQASQWGEERIQRPDLTDATHDAAYGAQSHPGTREHLAAARTVVTPTEEDQTWDIGQQKRAEAIQAKRRRQGHTLAVDPEARAQGW